MTLKVYCDGGARGNPGPAAGAFVAYDGRTGNVRVKRGKYLEVATNNEAEYGAVIEALSWILGNLGDLRGLREVQFYLDSSLVVNQLNGRFKVKEARLRALLLKVREREQSLGMEVTYQYVPREENFEADLLVNEVLDREMGG